MNYQCDLDILLILTKSKWRFLSLWPQLWSGWARACLTYSPSWKSVSINSPNKTQNWVSLPDQAQLLIPEGIARGGGWRMQCSDWSALGHVPTSGVKSEILLSRTTQTGVGDRWFSKGKLGSPRNLLRGQKVLSHHQLLNYRFWIWNRSSWFQN